MLPKISSALGDPTLIRVPVVRETISATSLITHVSNCPKGLVNAQTYRPSSSNEGHTHALIWNSMEPNHHRALCNLCGGTKTVSGCLIGTFAIRLNSSPGPSGPSDLFGKTDFNCPGHASEKPPAQIEAVGRGGEHSDEEHDAAEDHISTERFDVNPPSCRPGNHLSKRSHNIKSPDLPVYRAGLQLSRRVETVRQLTRAIGLRRDAF
jgi:hypothetical protein